MTLDKICLHYKSTSIVHYGIGYDGVKPDCHSCDGRGVDAEKHQWACYIPRRGYRKKYIMPMVKKRGTEI